ncbi:MAG: signal peptidase I [Holosporales bacterium]|jgi:signal peptidase I|nr:signal peptidase I [Holosporales bacterium]
MSKSLKQHCVDWWKQEARSFFTLLFCALLFRTCVYEMFQIPSGSMEPSLLIGDMPLVEKWAYGYSYHSILFSPPLFKGRFFFSSPKRGEVVVFKLPADTSTNLIKRVIGLPGDRIQILNGVVHVNGEKARLTPIPEKHFHKGDLAKGDLAQYVTDCYEEVLPGCTESHIVAYYPPHADHPCNHTKEFVVPADHYFMMGDNRCFSQDSRFTIPGLIHKDLLVGRAVRVVYRLDASVRWWEFWLWFQNLYYDRTWHKIR